MCVQKRMALIFLRSRLIEKLLWNESYVHYHSLEIDNASAYSTVSRMQFE